MIPISLDAVKTTLKFMPLDSELKDSLLKNVEILIEFRSHLTQKYSIKESKAETMIKDHLQSKFNGSADVIAQLASEYAKSQGFEKSDELESAITELVKFQKRLNGN